MNRENRPPNRKRSLLAFYAAALLIFGLAVGGFFAWTPAKVAYYHHRLQSLPDGYERALAARELLRIGPPAGVVFRRCLDDGDKETLLLLVQAADLFGDEINCAWCMPYVAEIVERDMGWDLTVRSFNVSNKAAGTSFISAEDAAIPNARTPALVKAHRLQFLKWWKDTGRRKYGSPIH
jgi:hypothetical protein